MHGKIVAGSHAVTSPISQWVSWPDNRLVLDGLLYSISLTYCK